MTTLCQWKMSSILGPLYLVASDRGLRGVYWRKQKLPLVRSLAGSTPELRILAQAALEIEEYLERSRKSFDVALDIQGTPFQKTVWSALLKIPFGKTVSYTDVAARIKNERAVRAVGSANAKNPLCIIVPCHRVIAASAKLGGYSGGLALKTKLLALEGVRL